jgi:predicted transcriptional regulator
VSLARLEPGEVDPRASTLMLVHNALTDAEIEFPSADVGVRLESR